MDLFKFFICSFLIYFLRIILIPFVLLLAILGYPIYFVLSNKNERIVDFYNWAFMFLMGPPYGLFAISLSFFAMLIWTLF